MSAMYGPDQTGLSPGTKRLLVVACLLIAIAVIGSGFALMGEGFGEFSESTEEALEVLSRLAALIAVGFIFLEMMTGSFRPLFLRVFTGATMRTAHVTFGLLGLAFALAHLGLLIPVIGEPWREDDRVLFLFGPIALGLLIITIATALYRNRGLHRTWAWIHLLNYLIFAGVIFHGLVIGHEGDLLATRILFVAYLALALVGLFYRFAFTNWRSRLRGPAV